MWVRFPSPQLQATYKTINCIGSIPIFSANFREISLMVKHMTVNHEIIKVAMFKAVILTAFFVVTPFN